ncbi:MAG: hypothetical protein K6G29_13290, partial [Clostridiales bacterium]|nr:hypothetical protein [Clostridiales bacterium]
RNTRSVPEAGTANGSWGTDKLTDLPVSTVLTAGGLNELITHTSIGWLKISFVRLSLRESAETRLFLRLCRFSSSVFFHILIVRSFRIRATWLT